MTKLNVVVYNKLFLQGEEAKEQGLIKLAHNIFTAIGPMPEDEGVEYSSAQLHENVQQDLWKIATHVLKYHDVQSVDAAKIDETIHILAEKFIDELENVLDVDLSLISPLEPRVPGEK